MRLLFAAGDVGGARAILPLANLAHVKGHHIIAHQHGSFFNEGHKSWDWRKKQVLLSNQFWADERPEYLVFATSVKDQNALEIFLRAREAGISNLHVLDNWSNYRSRFERKGLPFHLPDNYAVMDEVAFEGAVQEGISSDTLMISGHPNLKHLSKTFPLPKISNENQSLNIIFVSEPASIDNINSIHRGYDEIEVTSIFCDALKTSQHMNLYIASHPRESYQDVRTRWARHLSSKNNISWEITEGNNTKHALLTSDYVIGMSSILLYEAWIHGKTVISIQPNLTLKSLESFTKRPGIKAFTKATFAANYLNKLFGNEQVHKPKPKGIKRMQIDRHANASETLLDFISS